MDPVNVHILDSIGGHAAGGVIAFGAAVYRTAAKVVNGCLCTVAGTGMVGIAIDDMVVKTIDGFYSQYDNVPLWTEGRGRVWVTPSEDDTSIEAGDFLELAVLGSSNTLPVGVFVEAVADTPAGAERTTNSMAQALEDKTLSSALKWVLTVESVSIGDKTITLDATKAALFTVGDYIILEDLDGNVMMNRVTAISGSVLTLAIASTVALTGTTDYLHILTQVEAKLI